MGGLCHVNLFSPKHEILHGNTDLCGCNKIGGFTKTLYFTSGGAMSRKGEYNRGYNIFVDLPPSLWGKALCVSNLMFLWLDPLGIVRGEGF